MRVNTILGRIGAGKPVAREDLVNALDKAVDPGKIAVLSGALQRLDAGAPATPEPTPEPEPTPAPEPKPDVVADVAKAVKKLAKAAADERIAALAKSEGKGFMRVHNSKRGHAIREEEYARFLDLFSANV